MLLRFDSIFLLSQQADFRHLGDQFREETATVDYTALIIVSAIAVIVVIGLLFYQRFIVDDEDVACNDSKKLFSNLCQAHEIKTDNCRLLQKITRKLKMEHPALVFVDPSFIVQATQNSQFESSKTALESLGKQLFGRSIFLAEVEQY
ncbi:MAG: hypothetical protein COA78_02805 [Blastopirellula sp.]|nr:MAG: hypothetical protein COA78_02805 [Blastopirellula sp.]